MKNILAALMLIAATSSVSAEAVFDDVTDVTRWKVAGNQKEFGNEKFRDHTVAREMLDTWSFDQENDRRYQCNNANQYCIAVTCENGRPWLLVSDPSNRGYKIRFWSMDYKRKTRTPLTVTSSDFELMETGNFLAPTVKVWLTKELIDKMTFDDTMRIAYSFPLSDGEDGESPNDIFVHMDSSDGPIDTGEWFGRCAETTNLKTD